MAIGIGNLGKVFEDYSDTLNQLFGQSSSLTTLNKGGSPSTLFDPKYNGSADFVPQRFSGNALVSNGVNNRVVKYSFAMISSASIKDGAISSVGTDLRFDLDIPPRAISQKEIFATNIQATRRGIVVESEGVVFKDIVIQGTTGIFPGKRGNINVPRATGLLSTPATDLGISKENGRSKAGTVNQISGYEEFLRLRQFFLKYAYDKVDNDGDLFLVFINEKDYQTLLVEPLEFTMERNSKSPMTYDYRIVLKAIGTLTGLISDISDNPLSLLEQIGNISGNISAAIGQVRAFSNATSSTLQKTSQAIDETVNGPLRQIQFATKDVADGVSNTLSLPATLWGNFKNETADILEGIGSVSKAGSIQNLTSNIRQRNRVINNRKSENSEEGRKVLSTFKKLIGDTTYNAVVASRISMPRSFVVSTSQAILGHSSNIADATNLGDSFYNTIYRRTPTELPSPLRIASDEEFLLLGSLHTTIDSLNFILSNNDNFKADADIEFERVKQTFEAPTSILGESLIKVNKPSSIKEVKVKGNDTLERIAQREMGDALRWPELVIINKLKPPYLSQDGEDGTLKTGDTILVSVL